MAAAKSALIDTHIHFWEPSRFHYHWLESGSILDRDFRLIDLAESLQAVNVVGGIIIEATNTPSEIPWLLEMSEADGRFWGIIGAIDLSTANAVPLINQFALHPRFKGVRMNWFERPPDANVFDAGMKALSARDLVLDILPRFDALDDLAQWMAAHPDVSFVLEHLGDAAFTDDTFRLWRMRMGTFARLSNVTVKVSNYTMAAAQPPDLNTLRKYWAGALEAFGAERLMFGSNYPVCLHTGSYVDTVVGLMEAVSIFDPATRSALFHETAKRVYGLP